MSNKFRYYWEDFKLDEKTCMGSVAVERDEVIEFASRYDPQPFHIDDEAARESIYDGLIASGWHTCSLVMRLMCDSYLLDSASLGSPGLDNIRWLKPVRPGDVLTAYRTVMESRASNSRPDTGIVKTLWEVENQNGDLVLTMTGVNLFLRRNAASADSDVAEPDTKKQGAAQ